jgi:tetratricopeptide (TPR) repeat protein
MQSQPRASISSSSASTPERFCRQCGAKKQPDSVASEPLMQYCGLCGAAQYSMPNGVAVVPAPSSNARFFIRLGIAVAVVLVLGSASFGITRLLIEKPGASTQALSQGTAQRNGAQNNASAAEAASPGADGNNPSANPMSKVTPEVQARIGSLQDSLQQFPNNGGVLLRLANAWYDAGAYFQAERFYERYLNEFEAKNVAARVDYAYTLLRQGSTDEAIAQTKKALEYEPNRVEALYNLGVMYYGKKDFAVAKDWLERCIKAAPGTEVAKSAEDIIKTIPANQGS